MNLLFRAKAQSRDVTFDTVEDMANVFQTSLTATAIRLVEYGALPSMVVCTDVRRLRWFTRSEILPKFLWPHSIEQ